MPDLVGKDIGRYHIVEQLGQGGMAKVYKAFDTRLEREVAIKVIRISSFAPDLVEQMLTRFEREGKSLARMMHPNIVPIYDYGEFKGSPYLVMAYIPGGTLKKLVGRPLNYRPAARLLAPVARALAYAHSLNVIHRDVKPANILITAAGELMLSDFGVAKILEGEEGNTLTGTGVGVGTPEYMAPELWENQASPQSDIYALGVVFYELVTGRKPYAADTPAAVLRKQLIEPLPRPKLFAPNLPDSVEQILFKALAKNPAERYPTMTEFADALERLAARPESAPYPRPNSSEGGAVVEKGTNQATVQAPLPSQNAPWVDRRTEANPIPSQAPLPKGRRVPLWAYVLGGLVIICLIVGLWQLVSGFVSNSIKTPVVVVQATDTFVPRQVQIPTAISAPLTPKSTNTRPAPLPTITVANNTSVHEPRIYGAAVCLQPCTGTNSVLSAPEATTILYMQWNYENIPIGANYERTWTMNGQEWVRYSCSWPGPATGTDKVTLTEPDGLHSGTWKMTISINGKVLLEQQVQLEGNWNYWYQAGTFNTCYGKR